MSVVRVDSYLKQGNQFIPVSKYEGPAQDPQYIEGAIELTINGKMLLGLDLWDYVDQLWAYLIDGLLQLVQDTPFSTYLPDQPVQICFSLPQKTLVEVQVKYEAIERKETTQRRGFVIAMATAAETFFTKMLQYVPQNQAVYIDLLRKTKLALSSIGLGPTH
jgi:hypothetical protein